MIKDLQLAVGGGVLRGMGGAQIPDTRGLDCNGQTPASKEKVQAVSFVLLVTQWHLPLFVVY